ncbi:MAG: hypothetical protein ACETWO_03255 [Candidatus Hadarchaeaceae archaeon]
MLVVVLVVAGVGVYFLMKPGAEGEGEIIKPATLNQVTFLSVRYWK